MKIQLRQGAESYTLKATSFKKAYILIQSVGNLPADAPTLSDINLSNINVTMELHQAGTTVTTSFNGVGPAIYGALKQQDPTSVFGLGFNTAGTACRGQVIQANGAGKVYLNNLAVPLLEGGYMLKNEDYIKININTTPGFFGGLNNVSSSFYLVTEEALDIQQVDINLPYYYPITIDKTNPQFSQKACSEIYLLNSAPYSFATQPYQSIEVRSKYVNETFDNFTLETKSHVEGYGRIADGGSNKIYDVEPSALEDVQINLNVNTSLVTNGANWLFVSRTDFSSPLLMRAQAHNEAVLIKKARARGLMTKHNRY